MLKRICEITSLVYSFLFSGGIKPYLCGSKSTESAGCSNYKQGLRGPRRACG